MFGLHSSVRTLLHSDRASVIKRTLSVMLPTCGFRFGRMEACWMIMMEGQSVWNVVVGKTLLARYCLAVESLLSARLSWADLATSVAWASLTAWPRGVVSKLFLKTTMHSSFNLSCACSAACGVTSRVPAAALSFKLTEASCAHQVVISSFSALGFSKLYFVSFSSY